MLKHLLNLPYKNINKLIEIFRKFIGKNVLVRETFNQNMD